jgi:hypothetical protein
MSIKLFRTASVSDAVRKSLNVILLEASPDSA